MVNVRGAHVMTPLTSVAADRDALQRVEPEILADGPDARYVVTRAGEAAMRELPDGGLALSLEEADPRTSPQIPAVYLGRRDGTRLLAVEVPEPSAELDDPGRDMRDLRRAVPSLASDDVGIALTAVGMGGWHRAMRHCPGCGALLEPELGGWVLRCSEEGTEQFPRTDPAVIMAVRDQHDRLLLARNANFRGAFHSVLAGFVEPGERLEDAVAREVGEESGMDVTEVEYVGSQPWPFPRSLMLAFRAWCDSSAAIVLGDGELASARWFTREQLRDEAARGEVMLPGSASIGRALIEDWYGGPLPGEE